MPIPKFRCNECGKEFAKIILNPNSIPKDCPVCGAKNPVEIGPAFSEDSSSLKRVFGSTCDSCGDTGCGVAPSS